MPDSFCPHLHDGLDVTPTGHLKPCCVYTGRALRGDSIALNIAEHPVAAVSASHEVQELRRASLHNRPIAGCQKCYDIEQSGGKSSRLIAIEQIGDLPARRMEFAGTVTTSRPERVMLQLGDLCNFRCRMCKPSLSTRIAADKVQRGLLDSFGLFAEEMPRIATVQRKLRWHEDRDVRNGKAYSYVRDAKTISLVGGEPTLIPIVRPLLRQLIADGRAPGQKIIITTNGSVGDPGLIDLLSAFERAVVNVSVDGFNEVNDYIRFGSDWPEIDANIRAFIAAGLHVRLAVTIQICNAFSLGELMHYASSLGIPVTPGWVSDPYFLDIQQFPDALRHDIQRHLLSAADAFTPQDSCQRLLTYAAQRAIAPPRAPRDDVLDRFWEYSNALDADRGQSIQTTLPDLVRAMSRHAQP
tara:strand:- start:3551 stop:4786 length:1236 start_codon:yes stop_codon:yes gene_type:complete